MNMEQIKTEKGHFITANIFEAKGSRTILLISSATGVKQSYYKRFSEYVSASG
jgi:predicted alpha/beta hydrolase